MNDETSELRAELARKDEEIRATRAMLRIECAEYDDNDWPDNLHLADVVEKHLARQAHLAVQALRSLLADIAASGVEHDDSRLAYLTVQIERDTWDAVRAVLADQ